MKKIIHISLLTVYFVFAIGITILTKYCGSDIVSTHIINPVSGEDNCCDCCENVCSPSCCEVEYQTIKIKDNHQIQSIEPQKLLSTEIEIPVGLSSSYSQNLTLNNFHSVFFYPPPENNIYLTNCVFLI